MSYQVLARKWRPRSFKELVGQTHVLQALVNALDQDRLHHAYLFTGTRGVGKTTIARIFAKCLNCEQGVSSTPCGQCTTCKEVDEGRFVDLLEVDAASRTKVEDTRELLDNVQYAPTRGRYKVYLIDEVHMLSAHSFNALLKTLEEPPPHIKFLLATTDPQKLPVTVLSRCLQFSLKNMTPQRIVGHLENILQQEQVFAESAALWQLARAADGSMRDALSLTDQAIAFGNGRVSEAEVGAMLGTIDQGQVMKMVLALSSANAAHILRCVAALAEHSPDYLAVLDDMLALLHRIAIAQAVPEAVDNSQGDREQVLELAGAMTAEDVQLYYQIGLVGKKDLPLAPDPRSGFEMALLRMLAFRPDAAPVASTPLNISAVAPAEDDASSAPTASSVQGDSSAENHLATAPDANPPVHSSPELSVTEAAAAALPSPQPPYQDSFTPPIIPHEPENEPAKPPLDQPPVSYEASIAAPAAVCDTGVEPDASHEADDAKLPLPAVAVSPDTPASTAVTLSVQAGRVELGELDERSWIQLFRGLPLGGVTGTIGSHCEFVGSDNGEIRLRLDEGRSTLYNETHRQRIEQALGDYFDQSVKLLIDTGRIVSETPAAWRQRKTEERLHQARESIYNDSKVQGMLDTFSATVLEDSIQPVGNIIK